MGMGSHEGFSGSRTKTPKQKTTTKKKKLLLLNLLQDALKRHHVREGVVVVVFMCMNMRGRVRLIAGGSPP